MTLANVKVGDYLAVPTYYADCVPTIYVVTEIGKTYITAKLRHGTTHYYFHIRNGKTKGATGMTNSYARPATQEDFDTIRRARAVYTIQRCAENRTAFKNVPLPILGRIARYLEGLALRYPA